MAKELDAVIVVDVEATCWEDEPPLGQESEIIEIGVAVLDVSTMEVAGKDCVLVKPERSQVSRFCAVLTTLTQEIVDKNGIAFAEACARLEREHRTKARTWASYGDYDRRMFERQCQARGVRYPFGITHINVKNLFALVRGLPREVGMDEALRRSGLELTGTHHRGVDDAHNIARLLAKLLQDVRSASPGGNAVCP